MKGMEGAIDAVHYSGTVLHFRKPENKITITVLLADDQVIVGNLIQRLLERADDIQIVLLASSGQEAMEKRLHIILMKW